MRKALAAVVATTAGLLAIAGPSPAHATTATAVSSPTSVAAPTTPAQQARAAVAPLVPVTAKYTRTAIFQQVTGIVQWNRSGATTSGMTVGSVRILVVQAGTNLPTLMAAPVYPVQGASPVSRFTFRWRGTGWAKLTAPGNRIVVTATQHAPTSSLPTPTPTYTQSSFVTVREVQPGAPRPAGIGSRDCADRAITPPDSGYFSRGFDFCDFTGASLSGAAMGTANGIPSAQRANLTGADLRQSNLDHLNISGALLAGANLSGADLRFAQMSGVIAPRLILSSTLVDQTSLWASSLTGANFSQSTFSGVSLRGSDLRGANFDGATLTNLTQLALIDARGASFVNSYIDGTSLTLANFTSASFRGATYIPTASVAADFRWTTLCRTTWVSGAVMNRDCPRIS